MPHLIHKCERDRLQNSVWTKLTKSLALLSVNRRAFLSRVLVENVLSGYAVTNSHHLRGKKYEPESVLWSVSGSGVPLTCRVWSPSARDIDEESVNATKLFHFELVNSNQVGYNVMMKMNTCLKSRYTRGDQVGLITRFRNFAPSVTSKFCNSFNNCSLTFRDV